MRLESPWTPRLAAFGDTPADRLATALADDIADGRLQAGARLPAHRDLAFHLGIGLGSVTKAFASLERRGLVRSEKGRGCFVCAPAATRRESIDLAFNAPPALLDGAMLARATSRIGARLDPALLALYPPLGGHEPHRRAMARWLGGLGGPDAPERTLLCDGAQQALSLALATLRRPGETLVTEAPTYPGLIALARMAGLKLVAAAMDREGVTPEGLEAAFARAGARPVVYLTPTAQNPTGATMGLARRRALAELCRVRDAIVVEDDVYATAASPDRPALATLAPERTFYVNSLSKTVSPGLRVGALVAPPLWLEATLTTLRATGQIAGAFSCLIMAEWIEDGSAETLRREIAAEQSARQALALARLGEAIRPPALPSPHVWAPLPSARAQAVATLAAAAGVLVTPPEATTVDAAGETGLRICLGAVERPALEIALAALRRSLDQQPPPASEFRAAL